MIRYDLHIHSTASDGALSPAEVAQGAAAAGLTGFSLTDHDTVAGLPDAAAEATRLGLEFIPGVEISAEIHGQEVHLLAYAFDPSDSAFVEFLQRQRIHRHERGERFLNSFKEKGLLPHGTVLPDTEALTRPHLAALLIEHGAARDYRDAFERFLVPGTDTFEPKTLPDGCDIPRLTHDAGGVLSLAHPGHAIQHRNVMSLIEAGLDAIEVRHPSHDTMLQTYYRDLAQLHGLKTTGGTDFHRPPGEGRRGLAIGDIGLESIPF